jgi:hypothetical protein
MKKILIIITLVMLVSNAQAAILLPAGDIALGELNTESLKAILDCEKSVLLTEGVIYLQREDGSAYLLVLPASESRQQSTARPTNLRRIMEGNIILEPQRHVCIANTSFIDMLPDWRTIAGLALGGFLWKRRTKPLMPQTII